MCPKYVDYKIVLFSICHNVRLNNLKIVSMKHYLYQTYNNFITATNNFLLHPGQSVHNIAVSISTICSEMSMIYFTLKMADYPCPIVPGFIPTAG